MSQINSVLQCILSTDKYCKPDAQTYETSQHQQKTHGMCIFTFVLLDIVLVLVILTSL